MYSLKSEPIPSMRIRKSPEPLKKPLFGTPAPGKHEATIIHEIITGSHQFIRLISKIQASAKTHVMIITPLYWQQACIIAPERLAFPNFSQRIDLFLNPSTANYLPRVIKSGLQVIFSSPPPPNASGREGAE